jgi:hypothetical protein
VLGEKFVDTDLIHTQRRTIAQDAQNDRSVRPQRAADSKWTLFGPLRLGAM